MNRRLYRCRHDKLLAGVAGGIAEYYELDPSLVRILFFASIFLGGIGLLLYIGMAVIVPLEPISADEETVVVPAGHRHAPRGNGPWTTVIGLALIGMGGLALLHELVPLWDGERYLIPAIVIGIGAFLVVRSARRESMQT